MGYSWNRLIGVRSDDARLPYEIQCDFERFIDKSLTLGADRDDMPRWLWPNGRVRFSRLPTDLLEKFIACASRRERIALRGMYHDEIHVCLARILRAEVSLGHRALPASQRSLIAIAMRETQLRVRDIEAVSQMLDDTADSWPVLERDFAAWRDEVIEAHGSASEFQTIRAERVKTMGSRARVARMAWAARHDPDEMINPLGDVAVAMDMVGLDEAPPDVLCMAGEAIATARRRAMS